MIDALKICEQLGRSVFLVIVAPVIKSNPGLDIMNLVVEGPTNNKNVGIHEVVSHLGWLSFQEKVGRHF